MRRGEGSQIPILLNEGGPCIHSDTVYEEKQGKADKTVPKIRTRAKKRSHYAQLSEKNKEGLSRHENKKVSKLIK